VATNCELSAVGAAAANASPHFSLVFIVCVSLRTLILFFCVNNKKALHQPQHNAGLCGVWIVE